MNNHKMDLQSLLDGASGETQRRSHDLWVDSMVAAMYRAEDPLMTPDECHQSAPSGGIGVSGNIDIGNILVQLSSEVARAKAEAERERALRISLEAASKPATPSPSAVPSSLESLSLSSLRREQPSISIDDTSSVSLEDCLVYITSLPPHMQEGIYMTYTEVGRPSIAGSVILSDIRAILKPHDVPGLLIVLMNECVSSSSSRNNYATDLIPFSIENLQILISSGGFPDSTTQGGNGYFGSPSGSPSVSRVAPSVSSAVCFDDAASAGTPRLNLIEALNVQSDQDVGRIITVRKCHKLGFKSHVFLKQYFSRFGTVERVVLLPMRAKPKLGGNAMNEYTSCATGLLRNSRPSSMGFVVMSSEESVGKILAFDNGSGLHIIKGWPIEVRNFVRPADKPGMPISAWTGGDGSGFSGNLSSAPSGSLSSAGSAMEAATTGSTIQSSSTMSW